MKKQLFLLIAALWAMGQNAFAYDFSAVSPSGHTLYYKIIDSVNHYVKTTYPNDEQLTGDHSGQDLWYSYTMPSGFLTIPDTVSYNSINYTVKVVGASSFRQCTSLVNVVMSNTIEELEGGAFYGCSHLATITFSTSLRKIGDDALRACSLGNVILPESLRIIGAGAFQQSQITNITLNDSLLAICRHAFRENLITSLYIPASVIEIGYFNYFDPNGSPVQYDSPGAIASNCPLTSIEVDPNNTTFDSRNNCNAIIDSTGRVLQACNATILPDGVVSFATEALRGCQFDTLVLPSSCLSIGSSWWHTNVLVVNSATMFSFDANGFHQWIDTMLFLSESQPPYLFIYNSQYFSPSKPLFVVPCGKIDAYRNTNGWENITNIVERGASTVTLTSEGQGSANIIQHPTCTNDTAIVSATADTNYHFVYWSDGSTQNPYTVALNGNTTLTAFFAIDSMTVTATPADSLRGTVMGSGVVPLGGTTTLTAIPTGDNIFLCWSNGVHDNPYTLTVTTDTTLQAIFTFPDTIVVYDTVYVPVHDTTYVPVHDTTIEYINHYIHDTTFVNNYIHDTMIQFVNQYVHDTTFVNNYIHDTVRMTTQMFDTTIVNIYQFDTAIYNTYYFDTIYITTHHYDTIYITQEGIGGVDGINAKVYSNRGQIVVEGADGNMVTLYDVTGRILATKQDNYLPLRFDAPASGTYMIKIGNYPARKVVVIR